MVQYPVGSTAELTKVITEADIKLFAELTLDNNPVHLDAEYASRTLFKRPIAHGALVTSLISAVLGTKLPGPGSIYREQTLKFRRPVYAGDCVLAKVEVEQVNEEKSLYYLKTTCWRGDELLVEGQAVIKYLPIG